jgi:hypothetical protein
MPSLASPDYPCHAHHRIEPFRPEPDWPRRPASRQSHVMPGPALTVPGLARLGT